MSMMIKTKKTQTNLVKMLLASSVLLSAVGVVGVAQAGNQDIGGGPAETTLTKVQNPGDFYNFDQVNVTFTVTDGVGVTDDPGNGNRSIDNGFGGGPVAGSTLIFAGSSIVDGSIGASNPIGRIDFNGVAGKTVTILAPVNSTRLEFANGGAVVFNGAVANAEVLNAAGNGSATFNANMALTGPNDATIGVNAGDTFTATFNAQANFGNDVLVDGGNATLNLQTGTITQDLEINGDNARVNFNGNYTIGQDLKLVSTGTANVASNKTVTITQDLNATVAPGSQLSFDLGNTDLPGKFFVGNNANIDANTVVNVTNTNLNFYTVGTPVTKNLVTAAVGGIVADPILNAPNNLFIKFNTEIVTANTLNLVATRLAPTGLAGNIQGLATTLGGVTNTTAAGQPELLALLDNLGDFSDVEAQKEALASIAPLVDGGLTSAVLNTQETTFDLFSQRLSELRAGLDTYRTGYAAGSMDERGYGTWVKIFGSHADQNKRDNVKGYEAETWGLALGADMQVSDNSLVGVAFSWASADVNHDLNSGGTDIDSYQGALYGSWNIKGPLYFNWMGSVAKNEYDSTRHTIVNNFRQTTVADFEGSQYGARGELGYVYGCKDFYITPMLSLSYAHLDFDDYREEGNSTANQFVNYKDVDALLAGAGVEFAYEYEWYKATMRPEVHANISYDFIGDKQESSSQFVNFGGAYDTVGVSPARTDYNVGLSLTTYGESGLGMSISYDYNWKSDYHVHAGFVRVRYEW